MGEENRNQKNMDINITVDRSAELEEKDRTISELKDKYTDLESKFAIVAEKEFNVRQSRLGLSGLDSTNEADIQKLRDAELSRSNTALLNENQTKDYNGNNNEATFDSIESGILELNEMAKTSEVIKKELGKTAKRALKPNNGTVFDYELEPVLNAKTGKLGVTQLFRKPIRTGIETANPETEQNFQQRKTATKINQKWAKKD